MKPIIFTLWSLTIGFTCFSQNYTTLSECIDYAMIHNLEIRQQGISIKEMEIEKTRSIFSLLPSLVIAGNGEITRVQSSTVKDYGFTATGKWVLFSGFSREYSIMAAQTDLEATRLEDDRLRNEVSLMVTRAYLKILLCEELAECAKIEYSKILEDKERISALVKAGKQPASARFNIEAQCSTEYSNLVNARSDHRNSVMELALILDVPYDSLFHTRISSYGELPPPPAISYGEIETYANSRPDILALRKSEEGRRHNLTAAKGAAAPTISLTGSYGMSKLTENSQNSSIGIEVSIPLLDGYYNAARIKESRLDYERSTLERKQQTVKMISTIQSAVLEAGNLYNIVIAAQGRLSAAESLLEASSSKYRNGGITAAEYAVTRGDYLTAKSEAIRTKWQYIFQLKIVDYYRGIPIEL